MALKVTNFREIYEQIIKKLTFRQKLIISGTTLFSLIGIILVISLSSKPDYGVLFNNLDPADASKILEKLNEKGIKYQLGDDGKSISIPKDQVYQERLKLAGEGIPLNSIVGYEIFDKTNFGISDFQQKVNYRRALEGELVRTIMKLEAVEGAMVRIVIPEKALFKEDQKKTTASVILKLKTNKGLSTENITAITNLLGSSVEGLDPSNVTVIDSKGHLLSNSESPNKLATMSASQYDIKKKVELYFIDKAQSMLDQVLGPGKSIVRVNVDLNFNQVEKTQKSYDPNPVIRSQEVSTQSEIQYDTTSEANKGTRLTNYEVGETIEHVINEVGAVKRITVAALVDGTYKDTEKEGQMVREYTARSNEEINKIAGVIRSAVGYDSLRNDQLSIENIVFDTSLEPELSQKKKFEFDLMDIIKQGLAVVAMIGAVFILRSLLTKLKPREEVPVLKEEKFEKELPRIEEYIEEKPIFKTKEIKPPTIIEIPEAESSEEDLKQQEIKRRVNEYIVDKPTDAVNLVKLWLLEDEGGR
jgi:flagellar M-ring protein FliF